MKRSREPEDESSVSSPQGSSVASPTSSYYDMGPAPVPKLRGLSEDGFDAGATATTNSLRCTLHPRALTFKTLDEYDAHYNNQHVNRCQECNKNFPSDHILSLHIEECHDAFVAARRDRDEHTYSCFVEGCDRKCRDPSKRRRHLIDKHSYPPNFFFDVTRYGIEGRQSLLCDVKTHRRTQSREDKRSAAKATSIGEETGEDGSVPSAANSNDALTKDVEMGGERAAPSKDAEMEMDSLSSGMSSLKLVPRSISFGRGRKAGFVRS